MPLKDNADIIKGGFSVAEEGREVIGGRDSYLSNKESEMEINAAIKNIQNDRFY